MRRRTGAVLGDPKYCGRRTKREEWAKTFRFSNERQQKKGSGISEEEAKFSQNFVSSIKN